jgi:hypothetical protein
MVLNDMMSVTGQWSNSGATCHRAEGSGFALMLCAADEQALQGVAGINALKGCQLTCDSLFC